MPQLNLNGLLNSPDILKMLQARMPGVTGIAGPLSDPQQSSGVLPVFDVPSPNPQTPQYNPNAPRPVGTTVGRVLNMDPNAQVGSQDLQMQAEVAGARPDSNLLMRQADASAKGSPAVMDIIRRLSGEGSDALQVPQEGAYQLPPTIARKTESIPQRNTPTSTFARIAAALGGIIAPDAAGQFGAAALGGEQDAGQRNYEDALTKYKLATQQDNTQFEDAQNERGLIIGNDQRNNQVALNNQIRRYHQQEGALQDTKTATEQQQVAESLKPAVEASQKAAQARAVADSLKEQGASAERVHMAEVKAREAEAKVKEQTDKYEAEIRSREKIASDKLKEDDEKYKAKLKQQNDSLKERVRQHDLQFKASMAHVNASIANASKRLTSGAGKADPLLALTLRGLQAQSVNLRARYNSTVNVLARLDDPLKSAGMSDEDKTATRSKALAEKEDVNTELEGVNAQMKDFVSGLGKEPSSIIGGGVAHPKTPAEARALKSGTKYVTPDGRSGVAP